METCEPQSQGEKKGGQDKFWGKVSGPVGVSSRVQPLWLGKERVGRRGGMGGRDQLGSAAVWTLQVRCIKLSVQTLQSPESLTTSTAACQ